MSLGSLYFSTRLDIRGSLRSFIRKMVLDPLIYKNKNLKFEIGITDDLNKRMKECNIDTSDVVFKGCLHSPRYKHNHHTLIKDVVFLRNMYKKYCVNHNKQIVYSREHSLVVYIFVTCTLREWNTRL